MSETQELMVKRLFLEAAELPVAARDSFLDTACGDDAALRAEVEALLEAAGRAGDFLAAPTGAPEAQVLNGAADAPGEGPGAVIGRYKLLQRIGEGGFGVVFLAEQQSPVAPRVALKVIKLGMDTKQVIARFEAERQALAMMDHPGIARVLDAGATETGRPYFVMELVRGDPITEYCDRENLSIRERLELFGQVCSAVQHAHQKGVIHRDIKPGNILVTVADGKPVPKVIDFGIAKAISGRLTDKTLFTEFRQLIGTPEYMSPEQADSSGVDIDTRTDVYSLGVLLYELLTGTTPLDARTLRSASFSEIQRIIREEEPPRPSTRVQTLMSRAVPSVPPRTRHGSPIAPQSQNFPAPPAGASASSALPASGAQESPGAQAPGSPARDVQRASNRPELALSGSPDGVSGDAKASGGTIARKGDATDAAAIARHRRSDPKRLTGALRGELDWIVMKALEKNRARRYETANAMAMDIRRYLTQQPVEAGPPSRVYRAQKFVRRNRGGVLAAGLVAVALVLGMIGTTSGLVRAEREAARAEHEAKEAFVARQAEAANRRIAVEQERQATQVLEYLIETISLADPFVAGRPDVSVKDMLDQASRQAEGRLPGQPLALARVLAAIGSAYQSMAHLDDAERHLDRSASLYVAIEEADPAEVALIRLRLYRVWRAMGLTQTVENRLANYESFEAVHLALAVHDEPLAALVYGVLVNSHWGFFRRAARDLDLLTTRVDEALAPGHPARALVAEALSMAGTLNATRGGAVHAIKPLEEALRLWEPLLPPGDPRLAEATGALALALAALGGESLRQAEQLLRDACAAHERVLTSEHPTARRLRADLAFVQVMDGRFVEALPTLESAYAAPAKWGFASEPAVCQIMGRLTEAYDGHGREEEAARIRPVLVEKLAAGASLREMPTAVFGPQQRELREALRAVERRVARYDGSGPDPEAAGLIAAVVEARQRVAPADDLSAFVLARFLARTLGFWENWWADSEARLPLAEDVWSVAELWADRDPDAACQASFHLGFTLVSAGQAERAEPILRRSRALAASAAGTEHARFFKAGAGRALGRALANLDRLEEAADVLVESYQFWNRELGAGNANTQGTAVDLGIVWLRLGRTADCATMWRPLLDEALLMGHIQWIGDCATFVAAAPGEDRAIYEVALSAAETVAALRPGDAGPLRTMAMASYRLGDYPRALELHDRSIARFLERGEDVPAHNHAWRALALQKLGRENEAREAMSKAEALISADATRRNLWQHGFVAQARREFAGR